MLIDCDSCVARPVACGDCVVSVLLGSPPGGVDVDAGERTALDVLAASGLVPPLRLVPPSRPTGHRPPRKRPVADAERRSRDTA